MELYVETEGTKISKLGEMIEIQNSEGVRKVSINKITTIMLSNGVSITTDVIRMALEKDVDIIFLDYLEKPIGRVWNNKFGSSAKIRISQIEFFNNKKGKMASQKLILNKLVMQKKHIDKLLSRRKKIDEFEDVLERYDKIMKELEEKELNCVIDSNFFLLREAHATRIYYKILAEFIPKEYKFEKRTHKDSKDEFNNMLNYCFGILYSKIEKSLIIAGLDPFIGGIHSTFYNNKSLVYDFIENFRFLATEAVFSCFTRKLINKSYFEILDDKFLLSKEGKKFISKIFNEKMQQKVNYKNKNVSYESLIQWKAYDLAKEVTYI